MTRFNWKSSTQLLAEMREQEQEQEQKNPKAKANSAIGWTDDTKNVIAGCHQRSPGCAYCYAKTLHDRRHAIYLKHNGKWSSDQDAKPMPAQYAKPFGEIQLLPERLATLGTGKRQRITFLNSCSDTFEENVPLDYIQRMFEKMNNSQHIIYQVLTKREDRLAEIAAKNLVTWTPNIWQGVSIENDRYSFRADYLRTVPAHVRFISAEPLLGELTSLNLDGIHWVIIGGESGPHLARPDKAHRLLNLDNARHLVARCVEAGVEVFFKQVGGIRPDSGGDLLDGIAYKYLPVEGIELAPKHTPVIVRSTASLL